MDCEGTYEGRKNLYLSQRAPAGIDLPDLYSAGTDADHSGTVPPVPDGNGVDLLTGTFTTTTGVAIGDAETGLAFTREIRGGLALDNMLGEILISGSTYTVSLEGARRKIHPVRRRVHAVRAERIDPDAVGKQLHLSPNRRDHPLLPGAFDQLLPFGNAKGIVPTTITYPSGKVLNFFVPTDLFHPIDAGRTRKHLWAPPGIGASNTGYYVTFTYETNNAASIRSMDERDQRGDTGTPWFPAVPAPSLTISPLAGSGTPGFATIPTPWTGRRGTRSAPTGIGHQASGKLEQRRHRRLYQRQGVFGHRGGGHDYLQLFRRGQHPHDHGDPRLNPSSIYKFDLTKLVMTWHQDELGYVTQYLYDTSNRPRVTMPEGNYVDVWL